ncbi:MAG: glutamate--cysteine ligase [Proteobacteria bacterium]|jgi:glutamate--cysteine ligase|nr:glutamate--cysteine ligase [Pseudomonadota bacterium]
MKGIPNLTTALNVPLLKLEQVCLNKQHEIEHWFRSKWHKNTPPFYGSVDLRNSGYKLTPVDMNLFPGGFNNINPEFTSLAVQAINSLMERYCPNTKKILLIPENHTRNQAYLKNVYTLNFILEQAGIETVIGSLSPEITEPTVIDVMDGVVMTYYPIKRENNRIKTIDGFDPCTILLNNDLSSGKPTILENLEQSLLPPLHAGWYMRKKTNFFTEYDKVCEEFAQLVDIDPWQINAYFDIATGLDFSSSTGLEELAKKIDVIIDKIKLKYIEHNITETPYVVVKANNGTYGMGIMTIKSGDEILSINRKSRNKMAVVKDGQVVSDVIIQEGVHTFEKIEDSFAEPVIYMMDYSVIGGFYRIHPEKQDNENLNSTGAKFIPLSFACKCLPDDKNIDERCCPPNRFYTYSVIARLALLASSVELETYK